MTQLPLSSPNTNPSPTTQSQLATRTVRAGIESDSQHGAVVPPLHLSSTFSFAGFDEPRQFDYTRSGNPTRQLLADALAAAEEGAGAVVTSSGMSAVHVVLQLLNPGDLLLAPRDCYGGTHRLLTAAAKKGAFEVAFIDPTSPAELTRGFSRNPRMVWLETPSNPLLRITDIADVVRRAGSLPDRPLVVVDNTFLSPALQRPLTLGADVVVHSTTKYLNGHSDIVGGAVVAEDAKLAEDLGWWANCLGLTGSPFDAYLTLRGLRTLSARMRVHLENAEELARYLDAHPAVSKVYYPGLPDHPGHEIAAAQQDGFGAMLSFELAGGPEHVRAFVDGLSSLSLAESLGGVESLIAHPATMTHASMDSEAQRNAGIRDNLLRISVGIEDIRDLIADVETALERAGSANVTQPHLCAAC